jgi:hypothetical protein
MSAIISDFLTPSLSWGHIYIFVGEETSRKIQILPTSFMEHPLDKIEEMASENLEAKFKRIFFSHHFSL